MMQWWVTWLHWYHFCGTRHEQERSDQKLINLNFLDLLLISYTRNIIAVLLLFSPIVYHALDSLSISGLPRPKCDYCWRLPTIKTRIEFGSLASTTATTRLLMAQQYQSSSLTGDNSCQRHDCNTILSNHIFKTREKRSDTSGNSPWRSFQISLALVLTAYRAFNRISLPN